MCESLKQRVSELEHILGLSVDEEQDINFDVAPIKQKLRDLQLDFIFEIPVQKLHHLKGVFHEGIEIPLKDKIRSVNFSSGLMKKRAELLQDLQISSELVFNSSSFQKAEELTPQLEKANEEIREAVKIVSSFDEDLYEFYDDLQTIISDLRTQIDGIEQNVKRIETNECSKA